MEAKNKKCLYIKIPTISKNRLLEKKLQKLALCIRGGCGNCRRIMLNNKHNRFKNIAIMSKDKLKIMYPRKAFQLFCKKDVATADASC